MRPQPRACASPGPPDPAPWGRLWGRDPPRPGEACGAAILRALGVSVGPGIPRALGVSVRPRSLAPWDVCGAAIPPRMFVGPRSPRALGVSVGPGRRAGTQDAAGPPGSAFPCALRWSRGVLGAAARCAPPPRWRVRPGTPGLISMRNLSLDPGFDLWRGPGDPIPIVRGRCAGRAGQNRQPLPGLGSGLAVLVLS